MIAQYFSGQGILIFKLFLAAILGFIAALDRKKYGKGAGMRTYALIAMGACLFGIISNQYLNDQTRIAANIVSGIGFIGAGLIWQKRGNIIGVTTAAGIWATAAIGLAVAADLWLLAIFATLMLTLIFNIRWIMPWT